MKYGNIPKKVLNLVLGEDYIGGEFTLKDELDRYGEDILIARYLVKRGKFSFFHAWSEKTVFFITNDVFNEPLILGLPRNPPEELKRLTKKTKLFKKK